MTNLVNTFYYQVKPFIPRRLQVFLRRKIVNHKRKYHVDTWPIVEAASSPPDYFKGWPEKKRFALVLTHDVEFAEGQEKCLKLLEVEKHLGFRSSFNFVPERYQVSAKVRRQIVEKGFEVGVHGLNHDGKLFQSKDIFVKRSKKINMYIEQWNAVGFRAPAMHHNLDWIHRLEIEYDASTFDTDPFEPMSDGVETIFPFYVNHNDSSPGYVELPYTLPQDFTMFILMRDFNLKIWLKKLQWIISNNGMVLVNTHPDYMHFAEADSNFESYPVLLYENFLKHIKHIYSGQFWNPLPKDMARFWKTISEV